MIEEILINSTIKNEVQYIVTSNAANKRGPFCTQFQINENQELEEMKKMIKITYFIS